MPTAHVLIPAFNAAPFIIKAIESVLNQSYPQVTLLFLNDGSTDRTHVLVQDFLEQNPMFKSRMLLRTASYNQGIAPSREELLNWSKDIDENAYIFWLDADDEYSDTFFIERAITQMEDTNAEICLFNFSIVFKDTMQMQNAQGLIEEKSKLGLLLDKITETGAIPPLAEIDHKSILEFTSLGCAKVYRNVSFPTPLNCPFEDFVYMATLFRAKKITALPADYEPLQYLRHAASACGHRTPMNFTHHIPAQLRRFFDVVCKDASNESSDITIKKLNLAKNFVDRKANQYRETLKTLNLNEPNIFNDYIIHTYSEKMEALKSNIADKIQAR